MSGFVLRPATAADLPAVRELIPRSVRALSGGFYTSAQIESALRHVFGADTQLIADGTYWVVTAGAEVVGCGGWSRRRTLYGGDQTKSGEDPLLDPATQAARIRAFFIAPGFARRGLGGRLLAAGLRAAAAAGFHRVELVATLPGERLYAAHGFCVTERFEERLPDGVVIPFVRMARRLDGSI